MHAGHRSGWPASGFPGWALVASFWPSRGLPCHGPGWAVLPCRVPGWAALASAWLGSDPRIASFHTALVAWAISWAVALDASDNFVACSISEPGCCLITCDNNTCSSCYSASTYP